MFGKNREMPSIGREMEKLKEQETKEIDELKYSLRELYETQAWGEDDVDDKISSTQKRLEELKSRDREYTQIERLQDEANLVKAAIDAMNLKNVMAGALDGRAFKKTQEALRKRLGDLNGEIEKMAATEDKSA